MVSRSERDKRAEANLAKRLPAYDLQERLVQQRHELIQQGKGFNAIYMTPDDHEALLQDGGRCFTLSAFDPSTPSVLWGVPVTVGSDIEKTRLVLKP